MNRAFLQDMASRADLSFLEGMASQAEPSFFPQKLEPKPSRAEPSFFEGMASRAFLTKSLSQNRAEQSQAPAWTQH